MNAPDRKLPDLRVNPEWAKLPLFDRSRWQRVRFGDVVRQLKDEVDPLSGEVKRYIAGEHMNSEDIHIRRWGAIGDGYLGPAFIRHFRKGQVLYGSRRTYLKKVAVPNFDGVTANTTLVLMADDRKLKQELLPWLMLSERFTKHSIQESKGSTNPYINFPDIAKFEFDLPPLAQQVRIAGLLAHIDIVRESWIAACDVVRGSLEVVRQSFFHGVSVVNAGGSKDVARLGSVFDVRAGGTPSRENPAYWGGDIPWIKTGEVNYLAACRT